MPIAGLISSNPSVSGLFDLSVEQFNSAKINIKTAIIVNKYIIM
jgi:hypothetical protein